MGMVWIIRGLGILFGLLYVFGMASHFRMPRWKTVACAASVFAVAHLSCFLFQRFFPKVFDGREILLSIAVYPLLLLGFCAAFQLPFFRLLEEDAPAVILWLVFDRLACLYIVLFAPAEQGELQGLFPVADSSLQRVQLGEIVIGLSLFALLMLSMWKKGKKPDFGKVFSFFLLLGVSILTESFLLDLPKVIFGLPELSLWAVLFMAEACACYGAKRVFTRLSGILGDAVKMD